MTRRSRLHLVSDANLPLSGQAAISVMAGSLWRGQGYLLESLRECGAVSFYFEAVRAVRGLISLM